jgi:hypothetical protein
MKNLLVELQLEKNNEERFYALRSILLNGGQRYYHGDVVLLLNQFTWTANKIELLRLLIET